MILTRSERFDLLVRNFAMYALVSFFVLRAVEVLVLVRPLPFISMGIATAGAMFFAVGYLRTLSSGVGRWSQDLAVMLLLVIAVWLSASLQVLGTPDLSDHLGRSSHDYLLKVSVEVCIWLFAGAAVSYYRSTIFDYLFAVLVLALLWMVLQASNYGFAIPYEDLAVRGGFKALNHLILSEYMLVVAFLGYFSVSDRWRWLLLPVVAYILFSGGGRSSFALGVGALLIYEFIFGNRLRAAIVCFGGFLIGGSLIAIIDDSLVSRMLFAGGLEQDASFRGRRLQFLLGMEGLPRQILWGDLSVLVVKFGSLGAYMHNALSVIQFYGIFVFFIYVYALLRAMRISTRVRLSCEASFLDKAFSALLIYVVLGVLFVKFVGFPIFWLVIGYWLLRHHSLSGVRLS